MFRSKILVAGCVAGWACAASPAVAECVPAFASAPNTVVINPDSGFDRGQVVERFTLRLRNDGDSACELRLTVNRDVAGSTGWFPEFTLTGPGGRVAQPGANAGPGGDASTALIVIPAGRDFNVPYQVQTRIGWGSRSGTYATALLFSLTERRSATELANQRTQLQLTIPAMATIRFAGAESGNGPAQIRMGQLAADKINRSPPFAVRVLSTSGFRMDFRSENAGSLARIGGTERLPYRMTVAGRPMNLIGGDTISRAEHTGPMGDIFPVSVSVTPDAAQRAGDYSDRVTVSVTAI